TGLRPETWQVVWGVDWSRAAALRRDSLAHLASRPGAPPHDAAEFDPVGRGPGRRSKRSRETAAARSPGFRDRVMAPSPSHAKSAYKTVTQVFQNNFLFLLESDLRPC